MELTKEQVLQRLVMLKSYAIGENYEALEYAISSIKTNEALFTKDDIIAMLEDLKKEINPIKECEQQIYGKENWNFVGKCQDVIYSKINKLKKNK